MTDVVVTRRDPPVRADNLADEPKLKAGMPCAVTCARCGWEHLITSAQILAATWMRCPYCSNDAEDEAA